MYICKWFEISRWDYRAFTAKNPIWEFSLGDAIVFAECQPNGLQFELKIQQLLGSSKFSTKKQISTQWHLENRINSDCVAENERAERQANMTWHSDLPKNRAKAHLLFALKSRDNTQYPDKQCRLMMRRREKKIHLRSMGSKTRTMLSSLMSLGAN